MVSPQALKLNEILRNAPKAVNMDHAHQREAGEYAEDMTSEPEGVVFEDAPEKGGLWATPPDWDGESAIVYLYGGGYVISSPHSRLARRSAWLLLAWQVRLQSEILRGSVDGPPICKVDNRPSGAYTAGNIIKRRSAESPGGAGERGTHQWPSLWPRGESPAFASVGFRLFRPEPDS
jgi:hypothetical protein